MKLYAYSNIRTISALNPTCRFTRSSVTCITEHHSFPVNVKILFQRIKVYPGILSRGNVAGAWICPLTSVWSHTSPRHMRSWRAQMQLFLTTPNHKTCWIKFVAVNVVVHDTHVCLWCRRLTPWKLNYPIFYKVVLAPVTFLCYSNAYGRQGERANLDWTIN
jgi:hypothetical protein